MIDLHSHVLPGVDDGPPHLEGSLAMAREAVRAGTRIMAATPHIGLRYPVAPHELPDRVASLREALSRRGIDLDVVTGGELAPAAAYEIGEDALRAIALGGGSCVLLECPFTWAAGLLTGVTARLQGLGFRVLLGHPERAPEFLRDPTTLSALVNGGAFVQITAASLSGDYGRSVRRFSLALLEAGLVHVVASDAHDATGRPPAVLPILRDIARRRGLPSSLVDFVTESVPHALLTGAPVPNLPGRTRRGPRLPRW